MVRYIFKLQESKQMCQVLLVHRMFLESSLHTLKGLIFAGINFRGSYFRGTYFRDFTKNRENKFRENEHNRGNCEN